jgi:mannonate dehydratase
MSKPTFPMATIPGYYSSKPGIQIAVRVASTAKEEDLRFIQQLGVEWVIVSLDRLPEHSLEAYRVLRRRFEGHGLRIYRLANHNCHNMPEVTLNLSGRDQKIEEYLSYLRNLGAAGIHYATYAHMANGIWTTGDEQLRGGATGRAFRPGRPGWGAMPGRIWSGDLTHGRRYSQEEIWENYAYFIRQVAPVAEEAGVYIGIHPDDPPGLDLGGVPRCIFSSFEGYRRALKIADSPNIGVCLCVGCWLEAGSSMGRNLLEAIRYFADLGKLFKVHYRNVTSPLAPSTQEATASNGFVETFLDDGYGDMVSVMRALNEVGFDGAVTYDHLPTMIGGRRTAEAYAVGYMQAMVQATCQTEENSENERPNV